MNRLLTDLLFTDMDDDAWAKNRANAITISDRQFNKWEKLATLGRSLSLVMNACMQPVGNKGLAE